MNQNKAGTWIDGIAASEHLDSSGERIEVSGIDISSLTRDGVMNYEHKSDQPASIVGKIYEAKKILKRSDCENERHEYFWDKIKMPYVYVAGELFDGVGHQQAQEVAAMLRYDSGIKKSDTKKLINFSIEGSKLDKKGQVIKKCVARKVSVTITPCNKVCEAEAMPSNDTKKSLLDDVLNKTSEFECEIMKGDVLDYGKFKQKGTMQVPNNNALGSIKKPASASFKPKKTITQDNKGDNFKQTPSGPKQIGSLKVGDRINHTKMPNGKPKKPRIEKDIYNDPDTWKSEGKKGRCWDGYEPTPGKKPYSEGSCKPKKKKKLSKYDSNVRKTLVAGSGMGTPSTKVNGEAVSKSEVLKAISDENWETFTKKEELIEFVATNYPDIPEKEVVALAKTVAYLHMKKKEVKLSKMLVEDVTKASKYDEYRFSGKPQAASKKRAARAERNEGFTPNKKEKWTAPDSEGKRYRELRPKKQKIKAVGSVKENYPKKEDLEYPEMAASEDMKKDSVNLNSKHKSKKGGLTQAGRDKYNRETGGNLKAPVSSKEAKKSPKKAKRRKSFCARMSGNKGKLYEYKDTDRDGDKEKVPTRKKKALDRWDC